MVSEIVELTNLKLCSTCQTKRKVYLLKNDKKMDLDVPAYNSFVLFAIKNPKYMEKNLKLKRRKSLKDLGKQQIEPLIEKRAFKITVLNNGSL